MGSHSGSVKFEVKWRQGVKRWVKSCGHGNCWGQIMWTPESLAAGIKACGHGSRWGRNDGQSTWTRESLGVSGGSKHVVAVSEGQIMLTREWLGVSGGQIMWTRAWLGVSKGQTMLTRGSLRVSGGQIMLTREWLGVSGGQIMLTREWVKSC